MAAWILARELGAHPEFVQTAGGRIRTWNDDGVVWIRGLLASTPPWWHGRLDNAQQVEALPGAGVAPSKTPPSCGPGRTTQPLWCGHESSPPGTRWSRAPSALSRGLGVTGPGQVAVLRRAAKGGGGTACDAHSVDERGRPVLVELRASAMDGRPFPQVRPKLAWLTFSRHPHTSVWSPARALGHVVVLALITGFEECGHTWTVAGVIDSVSLISVVGSPST